MSVFNEYARYYDLLYRDKDYAGEARYISNLIQAQAPQSTTVLNLGCGSGRHDRELANMGYNVTGVDLSEEMLHLARQRAGDDKRLAYHHGDVRTIRLGRTYDVVISLFHVMSYQVSNQDLQAALATASSHLNPGGLFIFDCWYGPGVLTDRPTVRVKEIEDDALQVTRIAQPVMAANDNVVEVQYHVFVRDRQLNEVHEIRETHRMRYLFLPELQLLTLSAGFAPVHHEEWLSARPLGDTSWNALLTCRKLSSETIRLS